MYAMGEGVPKDDAEAAKWIQLAAEQGDAFAQFSLGVKYWAGDGVDEDLVQAHLWFSLAFARDHSRAADAIDGVSGLMTSDQIAEAERLVQEWKPVAER